MKCKELLAVSQQAGLDITGAELSRIAAEFSQTMIEGLTGQPSPLKMLSSYLAKPTGQEEGSYLSIDFGGTNVRVQQVQLKNQNWLIRRKHSVPLKSLSGGYDMTTAATRADELFDFLSAQIAMVAEQDTDYFLGHTFSFPCEQQALNQAVLISWTKEINVSGVEGQEIGKLLEEALMRQGLGRIKPCVIINDTVGTLLTAAYSNGQADIGIICGTGHNACYYEPSKNVIINMESGNFDRLPCSDFDRQLDADSEKPGSQCLEKMVAGRYIGEIVRLIAVETLGISAAPYAWTAEDVARMLGGFSSRHSEMGNIGSEKSRVLQKVASLVVRRSARLVAATLLGTLVRIDPLLKASHIVAVDGSLYEKMPGYAGYLDLALQEVLGAKATQVKIVLSKDGSGVGAAIAAALAAT